MKTIEELSEKKKTESKRTKRSDPIHSATDWKPGSGKIKLNFGAVKCLYVRTLQVKTICSKNDMTVQGEILIHSLTA